MALTMRNCGYTLRTPLQNDGDEHVCILIAAISHAAHVCACGHTWSAVERTTYVQPDEGAPRQAGTEARDGQPAESGDGRWWSPWHDIAVTTGTLVPTGAAVRLDVDDISRWLEPAEAHALAAALNTAATYAVHEDRAERRRG